MVIFLQYTLTDLRAFSPESGLLLSRPAWPSPIPFKEFVRGTGQIVVRNKLGVDSWVGENYICKIRNGIRVNQKILSKSGLVLKNVGKHLYANKKYILLKYEFAYSVKMTNPQIDGKVLDEIIKTMQQSNVSFKINENQHTIPLSSFYKMAKQFHVKSSTLQSTNNLTKHTKYIIPCSPQIYFLLDKGEKFIDTKSKINLISKEGNFFKLYGGWFNNAGNPLRIWVHERSTIPSYVATNRNLRISIMRIHSELGCFSNIFQAITVGLFTITPRSKQSDDLQRYLNYAINTFLNEENTVNFQSGENSFTDYYAKLFSRFQPGELNKLKTHIRSIDFRPQIEQKTFNFINNKFDVMNNKYEANNSQIGAMGDNAKSEGNTFNQQNAIIPSNIDYGIVTTELAKLKHVLLQNASSSEHYNAIAEVSNAEVASKEKNDKNIVKHLLAGGKWVFDFATKVGVSVVADIIKTNMH